MPEGGFGRPQLRTQPPSSEPQTQRAPFDVKSLSVTGIDETKPALAAIGAGQITNGRTLRSGSAREAVLNVSYARRNGITVGETIKLKDKTFTVVGLARSPLGGQSSDAYVKLAQLQAISDRKGRVNSAQVRATSTEDVAAVEKRINATLSGASVTTASDLADRVGGSLADAKSLSGKLGTALTIVGLAAAFLIASLLTLSSVTKRIRELGTLKAIGWPGRHVVRQVTGESVMQGALGGVFGALIGIGGAALVTALAPALEATVAAPAAAAGGPAIRGPGRRLRPRPGGDHLGHRDDLARGARRPRPDRAGGRPRPARRPDRRLGRRPARLAPAARGRPPPHRLNKGDRDDEPL